MMNVLGCLDVPTYGEYLLEGTDVSELSDMQLSRIRNKEIGFIFQQYNLIQSLSVQENVELPLMYNSTYSAAQRRERAEQALRNVGLGRFENLIASVCQEAGFEPDLFYKTQDARTSLLWSDTSSITV